MMYFLTIQKQSATGEIFYVICEFDEGTIRYRHAYSDKNQALTKLATYQTTEYLT